MDVPSSAQRPDSDPDLRASGSRARPYLLLLAGAGGLALLGLLVQHLLSLQRAAQVLPLLRMALEIAGLVGAFRRAGRRGKEGWVWGGLGITLLSFAWEDLQLLMGWAALGAYPSTVVGFTRALFGLLALPLGLIAWGRLARTGEEHPLRNFLDGFLFAYAALFFTWLVGLKVWIHDVPNYDLQGSLRALSLARGILVMGVSVWLGARNPRRWAGPLALIAGFYAVATLVNAVMMGLTQGVSYVISGHPASLVKLGALILLPAAVWWPVPLEGGDENAGALEGFAHGLPYAPPLLAIGACGLLLLRHPERVGPELLAWGLPLMLLLLGRQFLALRDLRSLSAHLEAQVLQRTQALESVQKLALSTERMNTVASLGAGLAHDLNNLIGVTKNYAELVEMDLEEGRTADAQDLRRIKEAASRAGDLTAQLMAFGRQQDPRPKAFCLRDHLAERLSLLRMVARPPAQLSVDPGPHCLPVLLDPGQMDQLLVNLLSNARDAMPQGGRVWVRAQEVGGWARLEVQDEGIGMAPEVRERIFEAFFTTKAPGKGTGLGLASVRALVEGWGGRLEVESALGQGTTFRILLPLSPEGAGLDPAPP